MERKIVNITTHKRVELVDLTSKLNSLINESLEDGMAHIYSPHSTSALVVNENEKGLVNDFQIALEKLIPVGQGYMHDRIDNNADSHIRAFLLGNDLSIPIEGGRLTLGTWQSVFFVELDGPRNRRLIVSLIK